MPYPNFHAARWVSPDDCMTGPDDASTAARTSTDPAGKSYDVIRMRLKEGRTIGTRQFAAGDWIDQAFRYPKDTWTAEEAKAHAERHVNDGEHGPLISFEPATEAPVQNAAKPDGPTRLSLRGGFASDGFRVDRETGTLRNASVITKGEAIGHGFVVDDVMLGQVRDGINAAPAGLKVHVKHAMAGILTPPEDQIEYFVGRVRNAVIDGDRVRADIQLHKFADSSPKGKLREWLMGMGEEDPSGAGPSIVFYRDRKSEPDAGHGLKAGRVREMVSVDIVDDPASNPDGMLSSERTQAGKTAATEGEDEMNEKLKTALIALGMPADATDEQALAFVESLKGKKDAELEKLRADIDGLQKAVKAAAAKPEPVDVNKAVAEALKRDRERTDAVIALGAKHTDVQASWFAEMAKLGKTADEVEALVKTATGMRPVSVSVGRNLDRDTLGPAIVDSILVRCGRKLVDYDRVSRTFKDRTPHERASALRGMTLIDLGKEYLRALGKSTEGLERPEIARMLFDIRTSLALGTSDFPGLLADAAGKSLLAAYGEAPLKWPLIASRRMAADFKLIKALRRGEVASLLEVKEGGEYHLASVGEEKQTYALVKRGIMVAITFEAVINDDLGAFDTLGPDIGVAARRTENNLPFALLASNPTLSDGVALFSTAATRLNQAAGGNIGAPTVARLDAAQAAVALVPGISDANTALDIDIARIVTPRAIEGTTDNLLNATFDPAQPTVQVLNRWTKSRLTHVSSAALDRSGAAKATTGWYVLPDPAVTPVLEMAFLQGQEVPVLTSEDVFDRDVRRYKGQHVVACGVTGWRGAYYNPGS